MKLDMYITHIVLHIRVNKRYANLFYSIVSMSSNAENE